MKLSTFNKLPEESPERKNANVGDMFLQGENMIEQKITKHAGDSITYYAIDRLTNNGYSFTAHYDKLEE